MGQDSKLGSSRGGRGGEGGGGAGWDAAASLQKMAAGVGSGHAAVTRSGRMCAVWKLDVKCAALLAGAAVLCCAVTVTVRV